MESDKIYLVPHTHYDAVWIFEEEEYFKLNELILEKVVKLMEENDEFKFLIEQTYLLEKLKEKNPELYRKIKRFVKERRIEIAGGEYLMPDFMLPQEETLIREILRGRKWLKKEFGIEPEVMWQADSFGLPAQFPQLCKKFGYKYVAFRRGCEAKKPSEFIWQALDGSEIIAHFMPFGYRAGLKPEKWEENIKAMKNFCACGRILFPCGSGTTIPREDLPELVKRWNALHKDKMKFALPSEFFKEIEKCRKKLVVKKGEMYSSKYEELEVFPDTCSSRIWIKIILRHLERKAIAYEKLLSVLKLMGMRSERGEEILNHAWEKLLFMIFHDVITGTSIDSIFVKLKRELEKLDKKLETGIKNLLENFCANKGKGIVIFNPLSFSIKEWVETEVEFRKGCVREIGKAVSFDEISSIEVIEEERYEDSSIKRARIGFIATLPPFGIKQYKLESPSLREKEINTNSDKKKCLKTRVGNFEIEILEGCRLKIYKDKKLICEGNELVLDDEIGDLYEHKSLVSHPLKTESGNGIKYSEFVCSDMKIEEKPSRIVSKAYLTYYALRWPYREATHDYNIFKHKLLEIEKEVVIYDKLQRIDCRVRIKNFHPEIRLRVGFSTKGKKFICDTQFGYIERRKGKYPCPRWACIEGKNHAITFINFGTPEYEYDGDNLYITFLRSVAKLSRGDAGPYIPTPHALELGDYEFAYSLYLSEKFCKECICEAHKFNNKPFAFQGGMENGQKIFAEVKPENIILLAFKQSESRDSFIARICEYAGENSRSEIKFFKNVKAAEVVDLNEEKREKRKIKIKGNKIFLSVKPFEILTLKVKF